MTTLQSSNKSPGAPSFAALSQRVGNDSANPANKKNWNQARAWQTNLALLLLGAALIYLSTHLVSEYHHFTIGFSGTSGWSATIYIAAVFLVLTQPVDRLTLPLIIIIAAAARIAPLLGEPYLSSDIYRYVWDGVVQHAHISPYRYVPGDPTLTFLRAPHLDLYSNINRRDYAHTIYPPFAQALFYLVTFISPTVTTMKCMMLAFEAVTIATLAKLLKSIGRRPEQVLLYAWCPLLIWEIAGSGHLDAVAMALISLALLARLRNQPVLTGLFLGLAVITKLYPIVLLPALLMRNESNSKTGTNDQVPHPSQPLAKGGRNIRQLDWKMPLATFSVIALGYAAYSSAGKLVFGFLGGYAQEEGITTGTRYFLLELAQHTPGLQNLHTAAFYILCFVTFAALTLWALKSALIIPSPGTSYLVTGTFLTPAFAFAAALMFLFSPHYPWYIVWLIPFFTLQPNLTILTYLMTFFYLFTTALADGSRANMYTLNKMLYGWVAIAVIISLALRNRTIPGLNFHQARTETQRPS